MPTRERTAPCPDVGLHAVINAPELWRLHALNAWVFRLLFRKLKVGSFWMTFDTWSISLARWNSTPPDDARSALSARRTTSSGTVLLISGSNNTTPS